MKKIFAVLLCMVAVAVTSTTVMAQDDSDKTTVKLTFRNADDTKSLWPFAEQKFSRDAGVTDVTLTSKKSGHVFEIVSTTPMYLNSKAGFMFGGEEGNYMTLPAVKGKTLKKVFIKFGGKGALGVPCIADQKGNVLVGGNPTKSPEENATHTWEVSGLKKGKAAKLMLTTDGMLKLKTLVLTYE